MQQVGMRPKLFASIARFEAALESKACFIRKSWTDVAQKFGYYDQMHMVHDFAEFTSGTPTEALNHVEKIFEEQIKRVRSGKLSTNAIGNSRLIL
jgi:hypothetical protein